MEFLGDSYAAGFVGSGSRSAGQSDTIVQG